VYGTHIISADTHLAFGPLDLIVSHYST